MHGLRTLPPSEAELNVRLMGPNLAVYISISQKKIINYPQNSLTNHLRICILNILQELLLTGMTRLLSWIAWVEKKLAMLCGSPSYLSGSSESIRKRPQVPILQEQTKTCTTIPEVHRTGCTSVHF